MVKIIVDGMELDLPYLPTAVNHPKKLPDQVEINQFQMSFFFLFKHGFKASKFVNDK